MTRCPKAVSIVILFTLIVLSTGLASSALATPTNRQNELLVFRMMILTEDDAAISRAKGQVAVSTAGGEPVVRPLDGNGVFSFTIPVGQTSLATFNGEFISYTLRFEFEGGIMSVFNDALPATAQEAVLEYYQNLDGTFVAEYEQDYLYMLAPADPGAFIMSPIYTLFPAGFAAPMERELTPGEVRIRRLCRDFLGDNSMKKKVARDDLREIFGNLDIEQIHAKCTKYVTPSHRSTMAAQEGEIPTLEISFIRPDGSVSFLEWVPVGGSGVINGGFNWATDLVMLEEGFYVRTSLSLTYDFLMALPLGPNTLAYRFIDAQGGGSNYRLYPWTLNPSPDRYWSREDDFLINLRFC
jgi:hypothetical protein